MPVVDMKEMLNHAYHNGYAVGAFDVVSLDFVTGVISAAERCHAPVILSLAESHFDYFDFELLMGAVERAAQRASVPVAIHLDHGMSLNTAIRAINLGCNGVMVDGSHHDFATNLELTRAVAEMAHGCGVTVEGELGYVPGVEGEDAERHPGEMVYTGVDEAVQYVQQSGIDLLAVSIGTVHGRMKGEPNLDFQRLRDINQAVQIPLVLHGGTGLSDKQYWRLIANGICKINYYTALADTAGACLQQNSERGARGYTDIVAGTAREIAAEAERMMRMWGGSGRATDLLSQTTPWQPVEHLILYNAESAEDDIEAMMAEGRRVLSAIPGVREVFTGNAVQEGASYRYSWVIRFCHPTVIDSYREHPDHVAFADTLFRPVAGDRISIDYQASTTRPPTPPGLRRSA